MKYMVADILREKSKKFLEKKMGWGEVKKFYWEIVLF